MKKAGLFSIIILSIFLLCSCSNYNSSYSATMLFRSELNNECDVKFGSLKGTLVMNTTAKNVNSDGMIEYDAELKEGELSVFYDINGKKELLFTIKGGESIENRGGKVSKGDKVTFIIETNGTAKGGDIEIDFD